MSEKPFIKLFNCSMGYFFYDVNKNDIVELNEDEYAYLHRLINNKKYINEINYAPARIKKLFEKGYLSSVYVQRIEHELSPYAIDYLQKRLQGITLQITQNCNFRCRYCSFSGNGYFDRKHNGKHMSKEMAYKSIDFLKRNSIDLKTVRVGFYGGEPLIEFDLIKDVVEYAKKTMPEKELIFTITTNGSLLNKEKMEYFVKNNFELAISLDGPREYHDRYRRYAPDGTGTFEMVYKSLEEIYKEYPDYFINRLTITAVIDGEDRIDDIQMFFNEGIFKCAKMNFSVLDSGKTDLKREPTKEFLDSYKQNLFMIMINHYLQNEQEYVNENKVLFSNSGDYDEMLKSLEKKTILKKVHHAGPCVPGHSKMLISADGDIFTCEKASNNSETMKIGNINTGLDSEKIYRLLNIGQITEEECKKCWAIRFCSSCAINIDNLEYLSKKLKLQECSVTKKRIESMLKNHVTISKIKEVKNE